MLGLMVTEVYALANRCCVAVGSLVAVAGFVRGFAGVAVDALSLLKAANRSDR
jgi:hypothetical protein